MQCLPETGFLKIYQIIGGKGFWPLIPVGKSTWWEGVKTGRFPKAVKLTERCTAWKVEDIRELIQKLNGGEYKGKNHA